MNVEGQCLCQKVTFSFDVKEKHFDSCHCSMCRNWGGGPVFTVNASDNLKIQGEENIKVYDSSEWAERGFCSHCGTHLFYRLKNHDFCNFNLGTIKGHEDFDFTLQIYTDVKPNNYSFANKTKMMTEKEVLEAFGID